MPRRGPIHPPSVSSEALTPCQPIDLKLPENFLDLSFETKLAAILSRWIALTSQYRDCSAKQAALADYAKTVAP